MSIRNVSIGYLYTKKKFFTAKNNRKKFRSQSCDDFQLDASFKANNSTNYDDSLPLRI
jgi:hypothetical protein